MSIFQQTRNIADSLENLSAQSPSIADSFLSESDQLWSVLALLPHFSLQKRVHRELIFSSLSVMLDIFRLLNISFLIYLFNFSSYFSSSTFSLCLFFCLLSLSRQRTLWQWTEISCTEFINMINDIDEMSWNTFNASSEFFDSMITRCHIKTSLHRNQNLLYSRSSLKSTLFFFWHTQE